MFHDWFYYSNTELKILMRHRVCWSRKLTRSNNYDWILIDNVLKLLTLSRLAGHQVPRRVLFGRSFEYQKIFLAETFSVWAFLNEKCDGIIVCPENSVFLSFNLKGKIRYIPYNCSKETIQGINSPQVGFKSAKRFWSHCGSSIKLFKPAKKDFKLKMTSLIS